MPSRASTQNKARLNLQEVYCAQTLQDTRMHTKHHIKCACIVCQDCCRCPLHAGFAILRSVCTALPTFMDAAHATRLAC